MASVRPSILSGSWYPDSPQVLRRLVDDFLAGANPTAAPPGRPLLVVVPHAGYAYSGPTAGRLFGLMRGLQYEQVFILAPSHRAHLRKVALSAAASFDTPLGQVPLATQIVQALAARPEYVIDDDAHAAEHAVEIQLPFLQEVFGGKLKIVPMLVPALSRSDRQAAAKALQPWCDGRSLLLVSTDFTHYGKPYGYIPFRDHIPERLRELDQGAIDRILARDPEGLLAHAERTGITMCGVHAAALALCAPLAGGGDAVEVDYQRSGDREGDYSLSVSYAALMLTGGAGGPGSSTDLAAADRQTATTAAESGGAASGEATHDTAGRLEDRAAPGDQARDSGGLQTAEKTFLLALARRVVSAVARGEVPPSSEQLADELGQPLGERLQEPRGAFVTLTAGDRLRGCIGTIEGTKPLVLAIVDGAVAAASRDPRFRPVTPRELPDLRLEISALTPLRPVPGWRDIVIGRHGILLRKGPAQAVFLPQVAVEQGWDRETTLTHLALKAGLSPDAWREGATFKIFEADVFAEEKA